MKPVDSHVLDRYAFLTIFLATLSADIYTLYVIVGDHIDFCPLIPANIKVAFNRFWSNCYVSRSIFFIFPVRCQILN